MSRKKSRVPVLAFALVVALLVLFSLFDYKKFKQEKGLEPNEQKLLTLTAGEVVEIDIKSKKQTIQLKSDKGMWRLVQPIQDDADDLSIVGLLNALKDAKVQKVSEEKSDVKDWTQYGLDPGVEIEIVTDEGKQDAFRVSDSSAYEGSLYVRKNDELFIADKSLARVSDIQVKPIRSHNIWRTMGDMVRVEIEYTYEGEAKRAVLTKGEKGWSVSPQFDLPLSQERVTDWLQAFRDLRANDFAADQLNPKGLDDFLLRKPSMKISFKVTKDGQESIVNWEIGQEKGNDVFVHTSSRPDIFKATKFTVRSVRIPAEQLLDANEALNFSIEQAQDVTLTKEGKTHRFVKGEELANFFQRLKSLEPIAAEFPSDLVFDPTQNHLEIKGPQGVILDLSWTPAKDQLRWLKISKFKERFKVSAERLNALLNTESLMKAKAAAQENHP